MSLAIFDLDNTLLGGDSDYLWGEFLCEEGLVDGAHFAAENERFYSDYKSGNLDILAYLRFALGPLRGQPPAVLEAWHREFMRRKIAPLILPEGLELLDKHRRLGDQLLIITATNAFITRPIATALGVAELLACEGEIVDGLYTGEPAGVPSFGAGKVTRLNDWVALHGASLDGAWFYSDSHNDLPLLEVVDNPVAVDPDERLRAHAEQAGWPVISLRENWPG
ncbi:HAD family hydrolase [Haliea sp. E17]|uniref:histidinol-phosphatase n=1 Tax=Haliea sp. E17 TaxID=3401576 RepID=UPI003AAF3ACB